LDAWENSEEARKQIEEANKSSTRYYERATGLETWFTLPNFFVKNVPQDKYKDEMAPSGLRRTFNIFLSTVDNTYFIFLNPVLFLVSVPKRLRLLLIFFCGRDDSLTGISLLFAQNTIK